MVEKAEGEGNASFLGRCNETAGRGFALQYLRVPTRTVSGMLRDHFPSRVKNRKPIIHFRTHGVIGKRVVAFAVNWRCNPRNSSCRSGPGFLNWKKRNALCFRKNLVKISCGAPSFRRLSARRAELEAGRVLTSSAPA